MKNKKTTAPADKQKQANATDREKIARGRKITITDETGKSYRVTVRYREVTEDERRIKRAIIEDFMKNPGKKW